jgi:RNA polymerase sigma factor (TIGR02999 family)
LLGRLNDGDRDAEQQLLLALARELRCIARACLRSARPDETLSPSVLINETYLKLFGARKVEWVDRRHFLATAARAMRQIVVDHARARLANKRGQGLVFVQALEGLLVGQTRPKEIVALDEALERLSHLEPRVGQVIEMRFFAGLSVEETANALSISPRTVKREWSLGRAWLRRELSAGGGGDDGG